MKQHGNIGRRHTNKMGNVKMFNTTKQKYFKNRLDDKNNWLKHSIFQRILSNVKLFDSKKKTKGTPTTMEASRCLTHQDKTILKSSW